MDERIQIVGFDPDIEKDLGRLLKAEGYSFYGISKKTNAIDNFKSNRSDLIILYHKIRSYDNLDLIKQFKHLDEEVEIIVLSSSATVASVIKAMRGNGAFDFILLPLQNIKQLTNSIIEALDRQKKAREKNTMLLTLKQKNKELVKRVAILEAQIKKDKQ